MLSSLIFALTLLPTQITPQAPFPRILSAAPSTSKLAPGVEYEHLSLLTSAGPLEIRIVVVDPHLPTIQLRSVLASNALISAGETVRSIAQRTNAVAAINGDYFDLGHTNQPLGLTVVDGTLVRVPRKRYALIIGNDGHASFAEETFHATVALGNAIYPLSSFNLYPPEDLGILTPAFGPVPPNPNVTIIPLTNGSDGGFGPFIAGAPADNTTTLAAGTYLVIGPSAYSAATIPPLGTSVEITGNLAPIALSQIRSAVGGGPLLLRAGQAVIDPDGPNFSGPIPATAVGLNPAGDLMLLEVDGRQATRSVGLTRPQLAALFLAFGASDAMALDGGGSSTLVATLPGIGIPTVRNAPSDGIERPVGDALVVTSSAPIGQPAQIAVRPTSLRAVVGASLPLHIALLDAKYPTLSLARITSIRVSPAKLGSIENGAFVASSAGRGDLFVSTNGLLTHVPIEVTSTPSRIVVLPAHANLEANENITFRALAFDTHGFRLALPPTLPWTASLGQISGDGSYRAGSGNAKVKLRIGARTTFASVLVGRHSVDLPLPAPLFQTYPQGGDGSVTASRRGFILDASFLSNEAAAYAVFDTPLPQSATKLHLFVDGDGCGAVLRISLKDSAGTSYAVGKTPITWAGRREVGFTLPRRPALTLHAIYLVRRFGAIAITGECHIGIDSAIVDVAGTGPKALQRQ